MDLRAKEAMIKKVLSYACPPEKVSMPEETKNVTDRRPHPAKKSGRVRIIFVLTFVAVLVVSATAATQFYTAYRLPDPETTDADGLIRWLVTVDLENHPSDVQSVLARRLEEEFGETTDWNELKSRLTDEYCRQLWLNIQVLLRPWFFEKMDRYHAGTPSEQIEVIDQLLDQAETWRGIVELAPSGEIDTKVPGVYLTFLMGKIEQWKKTSSPKTVEQINEFVNVIQARWLIRRFLVGAS